MNESRSESAPISPESGAAAPADAETAYAQFVRANLRRNYAAHFIHGMLGMTGFRLINAPTFLPAYLHTLSGLDLMVGLALGLQQLGAFLSPIFGTARFEHQKRLMPHAVTLGTLMRVGILGVALVGIFVPKAWQLWPVVFLLFWFGLFNGMQRVVFQTLLGKVIPVDMRGRLQAWRNAWGGVVAAGLAWVAGRYLVEPNVFGNGYAATFLLAFVLTSLGLSALVLLVREPEPPTIRPPTPMRDRLRELPGLLREDPGFFWFNVVLVLANAGRMAAPFYILHAGETVELTGGAIGMFSLVFLGAETVTNLIWGYAGDRWGFRRVVLGSLGVWIIGLGVMLSTSGLWPLIGAFALLGAAQAGFWMAGMTLALEFGRRDDVSMRLAMVATAEGSMAMLGPVLGGLIAWAFGYAALFAIALALVAAALVVMLWKVDEPRDRPG